MDGSNGTTPNPMTPIPTPPIPTTPIPNELKSALPLRSVLRPATDAERAAALLAAAPTDLSPGTDPQPAGPATGPTDGPGGPPDDPRYLVGGTIARGEWERSWTPPMCGSGARLR